VTIEGGPRSFWIEPGTTSGKYSWTVTVNKGGRYSVTMEREVLNYDTKSK